MDDNHVDELMNDGLKGKGRKLEQPSVRRKLRLRIPM